MASLNRLKEKEVELIEKLVTLRRVAKVTKGGKRFAFSALVVVGDGKGLVGYSIGKAREVPDAVKKATEAAKKQMKRISLKDGGRTTFYDLKASAGAADVFIRSAPAGTGIIAGGSMRAVFEALGIQDVVSKSNGTNNPINMVRATIMALQSSRSPRQIAGARGKSMNEITSRLKRV